MTAQLHIVGSSASVPNPSNACSSYILAGETTRLLLDCGHGAVASARKRFDLTEVDAAFISHMHPDHMGDIFALRGFEYRNPRRPLMKLIMSSFSANVLAHTVTALQLEPGYFSQHFEIEEVNPGDSTSVGEFVVDAIEAHHNIESQMYRVARGASRLLYTGDTAPSMLLKNAAATVDTLLIENTNPVGLDSGPGNWHLGPEDVADLLDRIGPRRTILTHYFEDRIVDNLAYLQARHPKTDITRATPGGIHDF